jgi:hypothetical protein
MKHLLCRLLGHRMVEWSSQKGGLTGRTWQYLKCERCDKHV